jgi:hypothetical protein
MSDEPAKALAEAIIQTAEALDRFTKAVERLTNGPYGVGVHHYHHGQPLSSWRPSSSADVR